MKYADGQQVFVGDRVRITHDMTGVVIADMERGVYRDENAKDSWSSLKFGIMIESEEAGPFHYGEDHVGELELIGRGRPTSG
jgi:hypothetical protein